MYNIDFDENQNALKNNFLFESNGHVLQLAEDSTTTIPLEMLNFNWFQINVVESKVKMNKVTELSFPDLDEIDEPAYSRYNWSDPVLLDIQTLSQTQLFQTKPYTLKCWASNRQSFQTDGELTPEIYLK